MAGKEYQMAFAIGAKLQGQFGATFRNAQSSIAGLQSRIESLNRKQGDIAAYQKQQKAAEQTRAKLEMLQKQYDNLKSAMGENGEASATLKNQMLQKELQIQKTTQALEGQEKKLTNMGNALTQAGVDTNNLGQASQSLASSLDGLKAEQEQVAEAAQEMGDNMGDAASAMEDALAAVGVTAALKTVYETMQQCAQASIEFEASMAGVKRTVGGSDSFLASMGDSFKEMSTNIPITTDTLAGIATTAGQLGISRDKVEQFTTVMAQLDTTTDLTADAAATMLAQFANITGLTDYERLGSVIAELGDATATTASKVVEMSQGMAASANLAGMSATDILAISAAVGSLGIEAQAGSTAMSTLISTLYKATETGENLENFASVAGMTAEQFRTAWGQDAVGAMNAFITGLNDVERNGKSAIVILDELGINNVRQTKAILGLASAGNLLSGTIAQANSAWQANTALTDKASVMYETTQAKLTMAQNAVNNLKIAVGDALTPELAAGAETMTGMLKGVTGFITQNPVLVKSLTRAVGVFGLATAGVLGYTAVVKLATKASALFASTIPGLNLVLGATAVIAGLTAGITLLSEAFKDNQESMQELDEEFDNLNADYKRNSNIRSLCSEYQRLQKELYNTSNAASELTGMDKETVTIFVNAEVAEGFAMLNADDFVGDNWVELNAESGETLVKAEELLEGGTIVKLEGEALESVKAAGFLVNEDGTIELTPEVAEFLEANQFFSGENDGSVSVQLSPKVAEHLAAEGFLDGTQVDLTGNAIKTLKAAGFLDGDAIIEIKGTADTTTKITVDDYIAANDRVVELTANLTNLEDVQKAITNLGAEADGLKTKAEGAKTELTTAQSQLADMQKRQQELEARLTHAKSDKDKSAIQQAIEDQTAAIAEQETRVGELDTAYQNANAQYLITQAAVDELTAKEQRLAEIKGELSAQTNGVVSATEAQTAAINRQIEQADRMAAAEQARIRGEVYSNATKQAKQYANAVKQSADVSAKSAGAFEQWNASLKYSGMTAEEVNAQYQSMLKAFDDNVGTQGFDAAGAAKEIQLLAALMGQSFEDLTKYADGSVSFQEAFGWLYTNDSTLLANMTGLNEQVGEYGEQLKEYQAIQDLFITNLADGVGSGALTAEEAMGLLSTSLTAAGADAEMVAAAVELLKKELGDVPEEAAAAAESATSMSDAVQPILDQMNALSAAYEEAYNSAYESMDGQFKLFEQAPELTQQSVDDMIAALESQAQYMQTYGENLKAAAEMGLSEGLIAQLSDGSAESAAYLAAIVADGAAKIDELNTAFEGVEDGKEQFASTVAEMQTDFASQMASLQASLETTVTNMEMSTEAAAAGAATVQAFADAAQGKVGAVSSAFARVAAAAQAALKLKFPGGYATGTEHAERGFKMVGEEGPELVWFNGGEKVMDAQETAAYQRSLSAEPVGVLSDGGSTRSTSINVSPVFNLSGNMDTAEVRAILDDQTGRIRDIVESALNEIESDRERMVYSR